MARAIHRLTAKKVAALSQPGRYADGGGLYAVVTKTGTRNWVFIYQLEGRAREMGLGSASVISLADARDRAAIARKMLAEGRDPLAERRSAQAEAEAGSITFGKFADSYIEDQRSGWANRKHAAQWASTLGNVYCATIRKVAIADVDVGHVLEVLKPIWQRTPETARRVRMRLEKVLDAARVKGLRSGENPARWRGNLDLILPRQTTKKSHHPALPFAEVPVFMAALAEREESSAGLALQFAILTAARTGEVLGATWSEIDADRAVWTVPAERMKSRRPHRVPLSDAAVEVLRQAKGRHAEWIFPNPAGIGPLSNMSLLMMLRRLNRDDITVHGFRSSFRDWASETTSFPREVAEMALAHVIENGTEAAYRRGDLFEKRRKMMAAWGGFATRVPGKVVQLRPQA